MNISTRQKAWAKTPTVLSRRLNELIPSLPAVGIHIKKTREGKDRTRFISINAVHSVRSVRPKEKADGKDGKDAILDNLSASERELALKIKGILTREGGKVGRSQLPFELMKEKVSVLDLESQLRTFEYHKLVEITPDSIKLGPAWTGDPVE